MTAHDAQPEPARCPFTGQAAPTETITRRHVPPQGDLAQPVETYARARDLLKSEQAQQAGFLADMVSRVPGSQHPPVLYLEGEEHTEMRRATAKYFTPTQVNTYQPDIARLADELIGKLARRGEAKLDDLSLELAVRVAAGVVGLTNSRLPGMDRRIERFIPSGVDAEPGVKLEGASPLENARQAANMALFYALDVKPAIEARRKAPQDDLISYLLSRGYNDQDILTECVTYGTAGMITTREFISVAAWHLLRNPELRAAYVHGTEKERHAVLHEILRLEPVVGTLYRRAAQDMTVGGEVIPQGSVFALDIGQANLDPAVMGEGAEELCPMRDLPRGVQAQGLSFGDGHHRCPGAFLAIKETDVFLRRLLIWNDLHVVSEPRVTYNEVIKGYELRGFRVRLGGERA